MNHCYEYPRPSVSTDCVVFGLDDQNLKLLLIQRAHDPFQGCWALPGGFLEMDEDLADGARRELKEETGLEIVDLEQLGTFGAVDRDPRTRVITVAHFTLISMRNAHVIASSDARRAEWFSVAQLPPLAFDHQKIVELGIERLTAKVQCYPIGVDLLPEIFDWGDLRSMYELLLGRTWRAGEFEEKLNRSKLLIEMDAESSETTVDMEQKFQFDLLVYKRLSHEGFPFEF